MKTEDLPIYIRIKAMSPEKLSREKLLEAGYRFIRLTEDGGPRGDEPKIKICNEWGVWRTHSLHPSKAARDREALRLVAEEKCLCGVSF